MGGEAGASILVDYHDPLLGGKDGELEFTIETPPGVDSINVRGSDGFSVNIPVTGTFTRFSINTRDDGSPGVENLVTVYEVTRQSGGADGPTESSPCTLRVEWTPVECSLNFDRVPEVSFGVGIEASIRNALVGGTVAVLHASPNGGKLLRVDHPDLEVDGNLVRFVPASEFTPWQQINVNGVYMLEAAGPGGQKRLCLLTDQPPSPENVAHVLVDVFETLDSNESGTLNLAEIQVFFPGFTLDDLFRFGGDSTGELRPERLSETLFPPTGPLPDNDTRLDCERGLDCNLSDKSFSDFFLFAMMALMLGAWRTNRRE